MQQKLCDKLKQVANKITPIVHQYLYWWTIQVTIKDIIFAFNKVGMNQLVSSLKNKVIVAIHAEIGDPCDDIDFKRAMACAAMVGGAGAIRVGGCDEIKKLSSAVTIPVIGFVKLDHPDYSIVRVTPTFKDACQAVDSGADILAIEVTRRMRSDGLSDQEIINKIKKELKLPIIADISTFDEAVFAEKAGVDMIATTLVGYTPQSHTNKSYDFNLLEDLCRKIKIPVIAEGHISSPEEAQRAINIGAFCVVVGSMISRPQLITKRFFEAIQLVQNEMEGKN